LHLALPAASAFFSRPKAFAVVLLKKMRLGLIDWGDYSTALEYEPSHVLRRIRYGEEKPIFLRTPVYEEISPYHKSPITESPADERR
jgi:hypothetical protein